jgi:RimJ/RimL family protein N-acetyltransferase
MLRFNDPHAINLISKATKVPFVNSHHQCVARYGRDDVLLGGVLFTDYNVASMQLHVASFRPNWLNRELLWHTFDYPFVKLDVRKLILTIPTTNEPSLGLAFGLGFVLECRVTDVFPDGDMLVLGMYRDDCKYLRMRPPLTPESNYGQERTDSR